MAIKVDKHYRHAIKEILWERDSFKELERNMVEGMVSPSNIPLYAGNIFPLDAKQDDWQLREPNYLRALVRLFVSMLLNKYMDEVVDMVLDAEEKVYQRDRMNRVP